MKKLSYYVFLLGFLVLSSTYAASPSNICISCPTASCKVSLEVSLSNHPENVKSISSGQTIKFSLLPDNSGLLVVKSQGTPELYITVGSFKDDAHPGDTILMKTVPEFGNNIQRGTCL